MVQGISCFRGRVYVVLFDRCLSVYEGRNSGHINMADDFDGGIAV